MAAASAIAASSIAARAIAIAARARAVGWGADRTGCATAAGRASLKPGRDARQAPMAPGARIGHLAMQIVNRAPGWQGVSLLYVHNEQSPGIY
jgi:hypothetical protein